MIEPDLTKFNNALAEARRKRELKAQAERANHPSQYKLQSDVAEYQDLVPDADTAYERTEADIALDAAVERIDILDAHRKWIGKAQDNPGNKRENIMIGCPFPGHPDKIPSAAVNLDKQTFMCYRCEQGGDTYDIAAIGLGYDYDRYKKDGTFGKLKREMAEAFGYTYVRTVAGPEWVEPTPAPTPPPPSSVASSVSNPTPATEDDGLSAPLAEVVDLFTGQSRLPELVGIEWRDIVPENTFLRTYLEMVTQDDCPEEYHFWNGLIALSLTCGRDVRLLESLPIYSNLFVCLLGGTGLGKSKSQRYLKDLLTKALPYDSRNPGGKGAKIISAPGSGEALVDSFSDPVYDPGNPKTIIGNAPVKGYVEFNELASLMGRASRMGSIIKPQLQELFDAGDMRVNSRGNGNVVAKDTFGCVISSSQPEALRNLLSDDDAKSGFLNRWVFAHARAKKRDAISYFTADLSASVTELKNLQGWIGFGRDMRWSDEAAAHFTEYFEERCEPAMDRSAGILSRLNLLAKKLVLLFAVNSRHSEILVDDVDQMIALHDYLVNASMQTEASVSATRMGDLEERLLEYMRKWAAEGKPATVHNAHQGLRKSYGTKEINTAFEELIKADIIGFASTKEPGKAGRPTKVFFIKED